MMNFYKVKLFASIIALASLNYSICYASDLQEDDIDKNMSAYSSSFTEDQIHILQIVMTQLERKELLNCRSVSKNFKKASDFILFKSELTQPIVRMKIGNQPDLEQLLNYRSEHTIPNITIHYDRDHDRNHLITEMQFRRFFNTHFSVMQSLKIDWWNRDKYKQSFPLNYNVILSLSKALTRTTSIQALNLNSCQISDKGMEQLAKALKINKTLKKLSLVSRHPLNIQTGTIEILFNGLKKQNFLEELDLSHDLGCIFTCKDTLALIEFLEENKSLKSIILENIDLTFDGGDKERFDKARAANKTLKYFCLT